MKPDHEKLNTFLSFQQKKSKSWGALPTRPPPLNSRPQHLIEAAKRDRLDQTLLFSALLTGVADDPGFFLSFSDSVDDRPAKTAVEEKQTRGVRRAAAAPPLTPSQNITLW